MKNNKIYLIVLLSLLFQSCIKEKMTKYEYKFDNKSSKIVEITPYIDSHLDESKLIRISPNETKMFSLETHLGKHMRPIFFFSDYGDSILVKWEDSYEVLYIADKSIYLGSKKTIDTNSIRSLLKLRNYNISTDEEKNSVWYSATFTFTEEDYEFAKEP